MVARSRPGSSGGRRCEHVRVDRRWRRRCCRCCSRSISPLQPQFRDHYALLFGWMLLIDVGLLAMAIARSRSEMLHAIGAATTLLVFVVWMAVSYLPGAVLPVIGFVALFVALYLVAPAIARRGSAGVRRTWASTPIAGRAAPARRVPAARRAASRAPPSPAMIFPALFVLVGADRRGAPSRAEPAACISSPRSLRSSTEAVWSSTYLDAGNAAEALLTYAAFAVLYLGVPQLARRRGSAAQPGGRARRRAAVRTGAADVFRRSGRVADGRLWGLALLLAILNAALFIESASASLPLLALAGSLISWVVLLAWWSEAGRGRRAAAVAARRRRPLAGHGRRVPVGPAATPAVASRGRRHAQGVATRLVAGLARPSLPVRRRHQRRVGACRRGRCLARWRS